MTPFTTAMYYLTYFPEVSVLEGFHSVNKIWYCRALSVKNAI